MIWGKIETKELREIKMFYLFYANFNCKSEQKAGNDLIPLKRWQVVNLITDKITYICLSNQTQHSRCKHILQIPALKLVTSECACTLNKSPD